MATWKLDYRTETVKSNGRHGKIPQFEQMKSISHLPRLDITYSELYIK